MTKPKNPKAPKASKENLPAIPDYGAHAGAGLQDAPPGPLPTLSLVSGNEREFKAHVPPLQDAHLGDIIHSGTLDVLPAWRVIPCYVSRCWQKWATKDPTNQAPLASFSTRPKEAIWVEKLGLMLGENFIVEDRAFYVLAHSPAMDAWVPALMHFHRTAIKASSTWLRVLRAPVKIAEDQPPIILPAMARIFQVSGEMQEGDGKSWHIWKVSESKGWVDPKGPTFKAALQVAADAAVFMSSIIQPAEDATLVNVSGKDLPF